MAPAAILDIGSRRELFLDDHLVAQAENVSLRLHPPEPREVVFETDKPWEGNACGFATIIRDGDRVRMYYKAWNLAFTKSGGEGGWTMSKTPLAVCYAESRDGLRWERPDIGLFPFDGDKRNNLVWVSHDEKGRGTHGFSPFKDANPDCHPEWRYKAVGAEAGATKGDLHALVSPDGIRWSLLDEPVMYNQVHGKFDSHNLVFWDGVRGEYRAYVRDFAPGRRRDIRTATSPDFVHWSDAAWLAYPGAPPEQLYTNQVMPYERAPHIFVGFPARYVERPWSPTVEALPETEHRRMRASAQERYGAALSDAVFMSSRDGLTFKRWGEAFIRPGPQLEGNWTYGDNYPCWGLVETPAARQPAPPELSMYAMENYWRGPTRFRRYAMRLDGFVSANAPRSGGEFTTPPLTFAGDALELNVSTSAAGGVRMEVQGADGRRIEGFTLEDCIEVVGDRVDFPVRWASGASLGSLAGKVVRLRFALVDADLFAIRFFKG